MVFMHQIRYMFIICHCPESSLTTETAGRSEFTVSGGTAALSCYDYQQLIVINCLPGDRIMK